MPSRKWEDSSAVSTWCLAEGDRAGRIVTWAVGHRSLPTEDLSLGWACPRLLGVKSYG